MTSGVHLQPELARAFQEMGFLEYTDIQKKSIPLIQEGKDVIGQSQTGSGKTAAFGFPTLEKVSHNHGIQSLVLVPTRELCEQVASEFRKFSKYKKTNITSVYGGVSINPQFAELRHADIVVGTPGRILDHLQRGTINLSRVKVLILDEADKMFEMGFVEDVKRIISQVPRERQTLLFSATISHQVHDIVQNYMKNPSKIKLQPYVEQEKMAQYFYNVDSRDKFSLLTHILKHETPKLAIIFCATRKRVDVVGTNLNRNGISCLSLHGGLSQNMRKKSIGMFHKNEARILVASDVAARGLDIKNVSHIINYDSPKTSKEYIHRIGRTARAGSEGKVISLISEPDHDNFRNVLSDRSIVVQQLQLPEFQRVPFFASERRHGLGQRRDFHSRSSPRRSYSGHSRTRYGEQRMPYHSGERSHSYERRSQSPHSGERSSHNYGERREGQQYGERRGSYHGRFRQFS
ncbi:DEAD/DEAH box helicase [Candidatus Woesearchaeota archaeon]|nr:DEAD/DEAH box helicase [Candidatus Woesearchaeota archaeon]